MKRTWLNYLHFGTHYLQLQTESLCKLPLVELVDHFQRISVLDGRRTLCFLTRCIIIFFQSQIAQQLLQTKKPGL